MTSGLGQPGGAHQWQCGASPAWGEGWHVESQVPVEEPVRLLTLNFAHRQAGGSGEYAG